MLTHSITLYLSAVLIWGSTWFAIKFQLGVVAAEVSLVYRFGMAAVLFPVIALGLSTLFEDYQWTLRALFGFALVLLGNYIVLNRKRNRR